MSIDRIRFSAAAAPLLPAESIHRRSKRATVRPSVGPTDQVTNQTSIRVEVSGPANEKASKQASKKTQENVDEHAKKFEQMTVVADRQKHGHTDSSPAIAICGCWRNCDLTHSMVAAAATAAAAAAATATPSASSLQLLLLLHLSKVDKQTSNERRR